MDEILDLPHHILEFATTEEHNKREISVVGRSGCGLSIIMKYLGEGTIAAENSGYFPVCSAVVMLKIEARSVCTTVPDTFVGTVVPLSPSVLEKTGKSMTPSLLT